MEFKTLLDTAIQIGFDDKQEYSFDKLKDLFQHREFDGGILVFRMLDELWMEFALLQHSGSETDDTGKSINHTGNLFWYGDGPLGSLKELRHSYFPGYVFYASPVFIKACCDILLEYFDNNN